MKEVLNFKNSRKPKSTLDIGDKGGQKWQSEES